ncbi:YHS domain-containing (seleno)protein [Roseomonas sp. CCTCC AB2023176]|uniref:YHS domain-containing (seleno)protein n=1 Tax=Roseomonas sp. CCTCC AB2023176 TaxID=3342640 RepID=UPI0035DF605F
MSPARRAFLAAALLAAGPAFADPPARVNAEGGVAIGGTDPVAYFTDGRPVPGRLEFSHPWAGATWRFASAENRDRFAADPERYAPAYGGFCAYAAARDYLASVDPQAWRIVEGRLYLNHDLSIRDRWARDIPAEIANADRNWPGLSRR